MREASDSCIRGNCLGGIAWTTRPAQRAIANELRQRYGPPVSQTYTARPGIDLTATFGAGGELTEFVIAPHISSRIKSRNTTISESSVNAIVNELIPEHSRRKHLITELLNAICGPENDCNGTAQHYEKVTIYFNTSESEGQLHYAVSNGNEHPVNSNPVDPIETQRARLGATPP